MSHSPDNAVIEQALSQAQALSLRFRLSDTQTRAVPFSLTPSPIRARDFEQLLRAAPLLGRLTQAIADDADLIQRVHAPLASADPFFAELLRSHETLHRPGADLLRVPLLLQRSDFMLDRVNGPQLVECNSIAAGMAPFGEHTGILQERLQRDLPQLFQRHHCNRPGRYIQNPATRGMAGAIAAAAADIAAQLDDSAPLRVLMVVQEREDNVFDQQLLERALHDEGVEVYRRTFRELHGQLTTGRNQSLQLEGCGTVHVVYLRAGYQFHDYVARDLDTQRCCDALQETRLFLEQHRVALNATVAQQLATSKRMQLHLAQGGDDLLDQLGFNAGERALLASVFPEMYTVDADSRERLLTSGSDQWVLKNQGEGGGHCLFDEDILGALSAMAPAQRGAWTLMRRLHPEPRDTPALIVRQEGAEIVSGLISEIGLFTAHLADRTLSAGSDAPGDLTQSCLGYLVRSKPADIADGGVHSGRGALDSLFLLE